MSMNYMFSETEVPVRSYPSNKVKNGTRYVLVYGSHISFSVSYHYYQYLISVLLPVALGIQILTDINDTSVFHRLVIKHINKYARGPKYLPVRATNADLYLLITSSDIELLFTTKKFNSILLKRLRSQSDGEMRGVIYEIAIAAAFLRLGYDISWLQGESLPEFTAVLSTAIDVEAKRLNRTGKSVFELKSEIRAIRKNLKDALKKKRTNKYIILIDSDIPPQSSRENEILYEKCEMEFKDYDLENTAVIITNSGYENSQDTIDSGKNSVMVFQGKNSIGKEIIQNIILSMHAKLPESISSDWSVN